MSNKTKKMCVKIGREVEWEIQEMKTQPYGKGGQVTKFTFLNCCEFSCKYQGTSECPYKK